MADNLEQAVGENPPPGYTPDRIICGTKDNYWVWSPDGWDLTRPATHAACHQKNGVELDCEVVNVRFDPEKTALVIIDMQNAGLHTALNPSTTPPMYEAQHAILEHAIPAARKLGIQVIWLNWGLTHHDLTTMPPATVRLIGYHANTPEPDYGLGNREGDPNDPENFIKCGEQLGIGILPGGNLGDVLMEDGSWVDGGQFMMQGSWNMALYEPMAHAYDEGKKAARPDVLLHKNRNSGLWNENTELAAYLKQQGIRTLLFSGINTDHCVGSTLQDAHAQGYDTIMLKDGCATDSPPFAQATYEFNCVRAFGFLSSCKALAKAAELDH